MNKFKIYIEKHPDVFSILLLAILCGIFLFWGLNFYPLIDVDETRYAIMSKDLIGSHNWNLLLLNSVPFLEKPPFYFWIVAFSIKLFGKFSTLSVRFPIALLASFLVFFTYFFGRKIISRKFGLMSAIVMLTSVFYLVFAHIAILDMVLTVWLASALYSAYLTHVVTEPYKKFCWWGFWTFAGLGFLAKGILAIAIPLVVVFIYSFFTKTLKEMFKPLHMVVGFIIFLLIIMPWHIAMYRDFGNSFLYEYFFKHHFERLINSNEIGRKHSFFYFVPVFLVAFMPWTIVFLASIADGCKDLFNRFKNAPGKIVNKLLAVVEAKDENQHLILFASIYFIVTFGVMSISSTKLPTYILPAVPAAALLTGYFWCRSYKENKFVLSLSTHMVAIIFIIAGLVASIGFAFLPSNIIEMVDPFKYPVLIGCCFVGMLLLVQLKTEKVLSIFSGYVITMFFVITFAVTYLFNLIYAGGENELVLYSNYANTTNTRLVTFDFAVKPSTKINYGDYVYFITDTDFDKFNELADSTLPTYFIVKNKNVKNGEYQDKLDAKLYLVQQGKKYSLYFNKKLPEKLIINPYIQ